MIFCESSGVSPAAVCSLTVLQSYNVGSFSLYAGVATGCGGATAFSDGAAYRCGFGTTGVPAGGCIGTTALADGNVVFDATLP